MDAKATRKFQVGDVVKLRPYSWVEAVMETVYGKAMVVARHAGPMYVNLAYVDTGEMAKLRLDITEDRAWEFPEEGLELDVFLTEVRKTNGKA